MDISIFNVSYLHSNIYLLAFIMISCISIIYIHLRRRDIPNAATKEGSTLLYIICLCIYRDIFPREHDDCIMNVKVSFAKKGWNSFSGCKYALYEGIPPRNYHTKIISIQYLTFKSEFLISKHSVQPDFLFH